MIDIPDVNVLVALLWERHVHHRSAVEWFRERDGRFGTTSITQTGFVRVSNHPKILGQPLTVVEAAATLTALCDRDDHEFVPDQAGFVGNVDVPLDGLVGHRQVTDALLVAIARRRRGRLVTFDRGVGRLGGSTVHLLDGG